VPFKTLFLKMQLIFCLFWRKIILKNIYDFPYLPNIEKCFRRETFFKKLTSLKLFYEGNYFRRNKQCISV
jgi:hypothetical protein